MLDLIVTSDNERQVQVMSVKRLQDEMLEQPWGSSTKEQTRLTNAYHYLQSLEQLIQINTEE